MLKKINLSSHICMIYIIIYITGQILANKILLSASLVSAFLAIFINAKLSKYFLIFILCVLAVFTAVLLLNHRYEFSRLAFNSLFMISNLLLAYSVVTHRIDIKIVLKNILFVFFLFLIIVLIISMIKGVLYYKYFETFIIGFSYNYISGLIIMAASLYLAVLSYTKEKEKLSKFISIALVIFCFLLYGRSGIIFSLAVFAVCFSSLFDIRKGYFSFAIIILLTVVLIIGVIELSAIEDLFLSSKFKEGLKSPRLLMLAEYMADLNLESFIMGVDLNHLPTVVMFNMNPHNSYLNLHAMYGVFAIIFITFIIIMMFKISLLDLAVFCYLAIYLGRGFLDVIIFPGILDFAFLSLLYMTFTGRTISKVNKK